MTAKGNRFFTILGNYKVVFSLTALVLVLAILLVFTYTRLVRLEIKVSLKESVKNYVTDSLREDGFDYTSQFAKINDLNNNLEKLQRKVNSIYLSSGYNVYKNYITLTMMLLKLERLANRNESLESSIRITRSMSSFDKSIQEQITKISDIKHVKTKNQILANFKPIIRHIASEYHSKSGRKIKGFFTKYFYPAKVGNTIHQVDTMLIAGDIEGAVKELKEIQEQIESKELALFLTEAENYIRFYNTLDFIYIHISDMFSEINK